MSALKEVMDIIKDFDGEELLDVAAHRKQYSSIAKAASEGTLQFPVMITRSLDVSTLNLVCSALERQFSSFTQIAMSMDPTVRSDKGVNAYIRKFHQNSGVKYDGNDVFNAILSIVKESGVTAFMESVTANGATMKVVVDNKKQMEDVLESLNPAILNDKFKPKNVAVYLEAKNSGKAINNTMNHLNVGSNNNEIQYVSGDNIIYAGDTDGSGNINIDHKSEKITRNISMKTTDPINGKMMVPDNILKDNDVKKSNELVPTTLHVRFFMINKEEELIQSFDFILGVKAIMHPIKSEEIIENVYNGLSKNGSFFNFIKWTTGEISFMKDLILNVKDVKSDIFNKSQGASHWWMSLKRRKNMANLRNQVFLPGNLLPNTTLVLSMEEVEYIRTKYGYNLMDERIVDKLMKEYFLLAFVIIDMSTEISHFFFDGQTSYQSTTFDGLRRETSAQSNINEVIKMANKLRV